MDQEFPFRTEYSNLHNQLQQARHELEKATQANQELTQRYYLFYQEATFSMYVENQKNLEIIKRLSGIITHTIPHLPAQHQETIMSATERAKNITPQVSSIRGLSLGFILPYFHDIPVLMSPWIDRIYECKI